MKFTYSKTLFFPLFSALFFFTVIANAQSSKRAGFLYNWENYDNSHENGLGTTTVLWDSTDMRRIPHAPETGIHPRVFFGPNEIPDIKDRLSNSLSGQAITAQIHAYTTLLHKGAANYSHTADYGMDTQGNRWIDNAGFWDSHSYYYQLITEDPLVWEDVTVKRKHITACIMALEAFECLMKQGETDPDTQLSYEERASDLAKAMSFWASLVLNDPNVNANTYNEFGGIHMALAYDLNYNAMTKEQQDLVRQAIAQIIPEQPRHGGDMMAFANTSNWSTLNSFEIICNLAIENETGYRPELTEKWMRALHNFITYGWYPSGAGYEGLGKNYQFVTSLIACSKRGYSLLAHPHVRAYGTQFLPAILQPFGYGFTSYDVWGGSGHDAVLGGYKNNPSDIIGLKWIFPDDPTIDFIWRNYIEKSVAHQSTGYVYQQIRPDDSYYNYLLPAAIFASDYQAADWNDQAANSVSQDYLANDRGLMVCKSSTDQEALSLQFHVRQDMGGHTHGDRNDFTLSGLGRVWIRKSYGGSQFQVTKFHSCMLIDDLGMGVGDPDGDKCRQPGKIMAYSSSDKMTYAIGDATYAYTWEWHWSPQNPDADHPWLGNNNWEKVEETWGDFAEATNNADHFDIPFYEFPHWHQPGKMERMIKRPYNPMEKLSRTAGLIRTPKPFVLIADVARKDDQVHNYKWLAQLARDLSLEESFVDLNQDNYRCDIILKEPADVGNRKLLVRVLHNEAYDASLPPAYIDTLTYEDFFTGNPYNPNPNYVRPRLIIESNSIMPNFKVLLFPFEEGTDLPITKWNATKDTLSVIIDQEETIIHFEETNDGDLKFVLVEDLVNQAEIFSTSSFKLYPNPAQDYVWLENLTTQQDLVIELYDESARLLKQIPMSSNRLKIALKSLASGMYYVKIKTRKANKILQSLTFQKI